MNIKITHRNAKVSEGLREKIEGWLENSQERYEVITSAHVIIEKAEREERVEATVHIAGKDLFAKASAENLYAALDALADKIDKQLDKVHQKQVNKKGTQRPTAEVVIEELEDDIEEEMSAAY